MPKLAKQRENLLLINGSHQYARRDRPKPQVSRSGVSKQRRGLCLISHSYIATDRTNPNTSVVPAGILNQVEQRLRDAGRGVPLQPLLHFRGRPALVEGPAQRGRAESVDTRAAARLLIGEHP